MYTFNNNAIKQAHFHESIAGQRRTPGHISYDTMFLKSISLELNIPVRFSILTTRAIDNN